MDQELPESVEDLNHQQTLKAAIHFTVAKICEEVGTELNVSYRRQVIATLSEVAVRQMEVYTKDLEAFAKHARRTTIKPDDVKLLARQNPSLLTHLTNKAEDLEKARPNKKGRKKSSVGDAEEPSAKKRGRKKRCTDEGTSEDLPVATELNASD